MKYSAVEYKKLLSQTLDKNNTSRFNEVLNIFAKESDSFLKQFVMESVDWQICVNIFQINPKLLIQLIIKNPNMLETAVIVGFCTQSSLWQPTVLRLIIKLYQMPELQQIIESSPKLLDSVINSLKKHYCLDFSLFNLVIQSEDFFVNFFVNRGVDFNIESVDKLFKKNKQILCSLTFYSCPWVIRSLNNDGAKKNLIEIYLVFYKTALKYASDIYKENYAVLRDVGFHKYKITNLVSLLEVGDVDIKYIEYYFYEQYLERKSFNEALHKLLEEDWKRLSVEKILKLAQGSGSLKSEINSANIFFATFLFFLKYSYSNGLSESLFLKYENIHLNLDENNFKQFYKVLSDLYNDCDIFGLQKEMDVRLAKALDQHNYQEAFVIDNLLVHLIKNRKNGEEKRIDMVNKWLAHLSLKDEVDCDGIEDVLNIISSFQSGYKLLYQGRLEELLGNFESAEKLYLEGLTHCTNISLEEEIKLNLFDLLCTKQYQEGCDDVNITNAIKVFEYFFDAKTERLLFVRKVICEILTRGKSNLNPEEFAYFIPESIFKQVLNYYKDKPIFTLQLKFEREVSKNKVLKEELSTTKEKNIELLDIVSSLKNEIQTLRENKNIKNEPESFRGSPGFF